MDKMILGSSREVQEYFESYESMIKENKERHSMLKLLNYFKSIELEFVSITKCIKEKNCLSSIHDLLLLDAKLQILFFFWLGEKYYHCTEDEIIEMAEADYKAYYNEMIELPISGRIPKPLIII